MKTLVSLIICCVLGVGIVVQKLDAMQRESTTNRFALLAEPPDTGVSKKRKKRSKHHDKSQGCFRVQGSFCENQPDQAELLAEEQLVAGLSRLDLSDIEQPAACPVCLEAFDPINTMILPCSHKLCITCLESLKSLTCHMCRADFSAWYSRMLSGLLGDSFSRHYFSYVLDLDDPEHVNFLSNYDHKNLGILCKLIASGLMSDVLIQLVQHGCDILVNPDLNLIEDLTRQKIRGILVGLLAPELYNIFG